MSNYKTQYESLSKVESISLLQKYGINTQDYLIICQHSNETEALNSFHQFSHYISTKYSIRTQSDKKNELFYSPKWLNIGYCYAENIIKKNIANYTLLISEALDFNNTLKVGTVALLKNKIVVEIAYGSGTVDKITREGKIDEHAIVDFMSIGMIKDKEVQTAVIDLMRFPYYDVIFEISWFPYPVGRLQNNYIVWDATVWK